MKGKSIPEISDDGWAPEELQMEFTELQGSEDLKPEMRDYSLLEFYKYLPKEAFPRIKDFLRKKMSVFWSTYNYLMAKLWDLESLEICQSKCQATICGWFNMYREGCYSIVSVRDRGQMVETAENPVQIDEARFLVEENTTEVTFLLAIEDLNLPTAKLMWLITEIREE
ncbi:DNA-binding transcription factor activity, RNA polymerase II-specific [Halocaridina rubra]|uniref:DNA-binding transcription factor activity, RNA polymerase II-specific n=1 Tax=Halocaridina rubra TaxID=373956 RepID=A0AAN9AGJ7_HALRR